MGPAGQGNKYYLTYSGSREDDCVGVARRQSVHHTTGVHVGEVVVVKVVVIGLGLGAAIPRLKVEGSILQIKTVFVGVGQRKDTVW